jgi:hypothetical protein
MVWRDALLPPLITVIIALVSEPRCCVLERTGKLTTMTS